MTSKVYNAKDFFKLQSEGKVARNMATSKKLRLDDKGYYLYKKTRDGSIYRQDVSSSSKVYARNKNEGVTMYSKERDRKRKSPAKREGVKSHSKHPQFSDREALSSNREYRI